MPSKRTSTVHPSVPPASPEVSVREAKARFSEMVHRAGRGEEVVVTWHGRPLARIVPMASPPGPLRVDRAWLERMTVHPPGSRSEDLVRADRDARD